ncbi:glutathione synthase/RimK-type ligase-like ATP-grasp enzyme [Paenibacillus sp. DS2015]|uniref:hypothetical protein n=1 Tax=Paenibacillus sp. DS2015 TaxID=3373917 RepID=UPI003D24C87C
MITDIEGINTLKKVLVITQSEDQTVDYLMKTYGSEIQWYRLDVNRLDQYHIQIQNDRIHITNEVESISDDEITGLYYRKVAFPDLNSFENQYIPFMQKEIMSLVEGIAETVGYSCLSRPSVLRRSENKIVQLKSAERVKFNLARTLITNDNISAERFSLEQSTIVKPISTGRFMGPDGWRYIQTNMVDYTNSFDGLSMAPAYFQEYIGKLDGEYRVTIIERTVHAVRIDSNHAVDWRKKDAINKYSYVELPYRLIKQCFDLMDDLDLSFGAFDFIKVGDEYMFLEINPNGQWLWLEQALGIPISRSIVTFLQKRRVGG